MKRILFLSKGHDASSTRYRALQFFPRFHAAGFEPTHATIAGSPRAYFAALAAIRKSDIVVVQRKTFPTPFLYLIRKLAHRLVFDLDDAIFCNSDGTPSPTRMKRFAAIVRRCDHVFAGNAFLAENATRYNAAVSIIPTCVDVGRYRISAQKPDEFFDVVWIGSRSTRKYLEEALPALRLAASRIPNLRLKIIADFDLTNTGLETVAIPWSATGEVEALATSHIGIAPMRNDDWSRGKCALKVLQYMAAGLPVVSSNAGVNAEVINHGETGLLVSSPEEWSNALELLSRDAKLREKMGHTSRAAVAATYDIEPVCRSIVNEFDRLTH